MSLTKPFMPAILLATLMAGTSMADDMSGVHVMDPYARASSPSAKAGAAFMTIMNPTETNDRLIAVSSDIAARVELHTHVDAGNGVMQMRHDEDGFDIPAGGSHVLQRGGDHVMFMGLNRALNDGDLVEVTLTFEQAGDITVEIPVDLNRKPKAGHGHAHDHGDHSKPDS